MFSKFSTSDALMVVVYATTVFVSASLLFVVQPMVGKMILPHLGGSSSIWTTCMLFFQSMLVVGYVYAHVLDRRVPPGRQPWIHLAIIAAASVASLPLTVPASLLSTDSAPAFWVLVALTVGIGPPLFVVSTSAPLFQRWFSYTDHPDADDPYYLYAASNVGSMLALLGYPFFVEPYLGVDNQAWSWSVGFVLLGVLAAGSATLFWRREAADATGESHRDEALPTLDWRRRGVWVFWAFLPSSLMLGVTEFITTDLASVPLLWVFPLAAYLGSFILVFARSPVLLPEWCRTLIPVAVLVVLGLRGADSGMALQIASHIGLFFLVAMYFHGRMSRDRPHRSRLTEFFIWMSVGGALGGIFNALVAPAILDRPLEYYGVLVVAVVAIRPNPERIDDEFNPTWIVPAMLALAGAVYLYMMGFWSLVHLQWLGAALAVVGVGFAVATRWPRAENAVAAGLVVVGLWNYLALEDVLTYERSFYANYAVFEGEWAGNTYRKLSHGTTAHGAQLMEPEMRETAVGYHHPSGPVGQVLRAVPHDRTGVAGLGIGAMASYGGPDHEMVFFEIDPVVVRLARKHFKYLEQCGDACDVEVGDARQLLRDAPDDHFDVLFMDAYNSDSVPTHLLTREAVELYFEKVDDDGVVVFHVSNRFLDVEGVVGRIVEELDLVSRSQLHVPSDELKEKFVYTSAYTVVARDEADLNHLAHDKRWGETDVADVLWTDDYSNIVSVFEFGGSSD